VKAALPNERGDFLISTMPVSNDLDGSTTLIFPHIVEGGGYTTEFIVFGTRGGESASGTIRFFDQAGKPVTLSVRE